ncbi:MAG TPA: hypothetical protein VKU19_28735 [Bryobacteraceae bacterium]|nr:hypothetical protein [Bryobacteraceae bacterium]
MKQIRRSYLATAALATWFGAASGSADTAGQPKLLHARTDLRTAQLLLQVRDEPTIMQHVKLAAARIGDAIHEIDVAAILDKKDLNDHPPIDARLDQPGRFTKVMALLKSARSDIAGEEVNQRAAGWRDAAFRHIDLAMKYLREAAKELHMDHLEGF